MEKLTDNQFIAWQKEHGPHKGQNVHPGTARRVFWETEGEDKYQQIGVSLVIQIQRRYVDPVFATAPNFSAFDEAIRTFQVSMDYSTCRSIVYRNGCK